MAGLLCALAVMAALRKRTPDHILTDDVDSTLFEAKVFKYLARFTLGLDANYEIAIAT